MRSADQEQPLPAGINIRCAVLADAETIARHNEAMALETEGLRLDPATIRAGVRAALEDPAKGLYLVAERGAAIAGTLLITYEWSDWRNGHFLWLQSVYVEPPHRRHGVFRALHDEVARLARSPGHCGLRLYMDAHNTVARATYERLGMRHRGYLLFESDDGLRQL